METLLTSILGYSAAVVGTSLMLPQIIKSLKTKRVEDISGIMLVIYFINCILWSIYGYLINSMPVLVCNLVALIISIAQIIIKVKYSKKKNR
jgi:MtN3 and saliva related transmembrane protein